MNIVRSFFPKIRALFFKCWKRAGETSPLPRCSYAPVYIYIYIFSYTCIYICMMYANLPVNVIVRLPHPRSWDSQGQETFLAPSADKETCNYETECSNHHLPLSIIRSTGLSRSKMKWWAVYTNLPVNYIYITYNIYNI